MQNYEKEIKDLHQFFEDYLSGKVDATILTPFTTVLDDNFTIVGDNGAIMNRDDIVTYVRDGYNQRPDFSIWTENVALKHHVNGILVATYEEWQGNEGVTTSRTSTVLFKEDATMRNGLIWLHVHESGLKEVE